MSDENDYRRDLARRMEERRVELRLYWEDVARAGGVSLRALHSARNGDREIRPLTQRGIEDGLQWPAGYIHAILRGKTPPGLDSDAPPQPPAAPEPEAPQPPDDQVRLPAGVAAQMSDVALRSIAPSMLEHVQDALARNPAAAGADLFPGEPEVARVWDIMSSAEPPFSLSYRVVYAATARLQNMQEEWRSRRSG